MALPFACRCRRARARERGFTLLELLVVMAIVALASAVVVLALPDSRQTRLAREAARLGALLESAREQSRATGQPVLWRPGPGRQGHGDFHFDGLAARSDMPDRWLQADDGDTLVAELLPPRPALVLGPEPLIEAQGVRLRLGERELLVVTDGLAPFTVRQDMQERARP